MKLIPYIMYAGDAEEALHFYKEISISYKVQKFQGKLSGFVSIQ